jgi:hypothetical protein
MPADDDEHLGEQFTYWHITGRKRFRIDPEFRPQVARGIGGPTRDPGLFVTDSPASWAYHPYAEGRKWAAEVSYPERADIEPTTREAIIDPARAALQRVIPIDEAIAETTGYHPKRGSVPKGYRYKESSDARR